METIGLAEIRMNMAKFECLLTQMAESDKVRAHEITQALPKLREARVWVEGALEKDDPVARIERRLKSQLYLSGDEQYADGEQLA
jgi:hypothetical protein